MMRDGRRRRAGEAVRMRAGEDRPRLGPRKPARVLQFLAVEGDVFVQRLAEAADHQRIGERPGLAGVVHDATKADAGFLRRTGVEIDPDTMVPCHNPDTYETNVKNLFIAGAQLAGRRTGTIFIENGRFHGEQVARVLAARLGA